MMYYLFDVIQADMLDTLLPILIIGIVIGIIKYGGSAFEMSRKNSLKTNLPADTVNDFEQYIKDGYKMGQLKEIAAAARLGVDYKLLANKDYFPEKMREIRVGLEHNINILDYCDSSFDYEQMKQIRLGLESGLDVSSYCDSKLHYWEMEERRKQLMKDGR